MNSKPDLITELDYYVVSMYYSIITITTVGYGDITPANTNERIFITFMALIVCGNFGYALNQIGNII